MSMRVAGGCGQVRLEVSDASHVSDCRRRAQIIAAAAGLDETGIGRAAIVATELTTNLIRHAGGGELLLQRLSGGAQCEIELLAIDRGRGMDLERCMRDGYSTGGTPGSGLGAVRRLSSTFDAYSQSGQGTVVLARIAGPSATPASAASGAPQLEIGAICVAMHGEVECGDAWSIAADDAQLAILVIDGLGHGTLAAAAARAGAAAFGENPFAPPATTLRELHKRLVGSRGAAAACAVLDAGACRLAYAGIGNIAGTLLQADTRRGLPSHNGTLGVSLRKAQQFDYDWPRASTVVLHSDGLSARWNLNAYPGITLHHPALMAAVLYRDLHRPHDDATVLVVSRP